MITPKQFLEEFLPVNVARYEEKQREIANTKKIESLTHIANIIPKSRELPIRVFADIQDKKDIEQIANHYRNIGWIVEYETFKCYPNNTEFRFDVK